MNMNAPRFTIGFITQLTDEGVKQSTNVFGDVMTQAINVQAAQMEAAIRAKLIGLGWTPPHDPAMTTNDVPLPEPKLMTHLGNEAYTADQMRAYGDARAQEASRLLTVGLLALKTSNNERDAALARVAELEAKLKEAEKDARRYLHIRSRYVRCSPDMSGNHYWILSVASASMRGPDFESVIDAAIAAGGGDGD